uniref:Gustatory receptor n=1 Tax=Strigamia maritima TaxID=126957 RepID=T1JP10_STRMM
KTSAELKKPLSEYTIKLKSFWSNILSIYGLFMFSDGKISRKQKTIFCVLSILQLTIWLHYIICFINTTALESSISKFGYYSGLVVNSSMSVFSLWLMNRRRISMTKLLNNSINYLGKHTQCMKHIWLYSLIPSVCLLGISFVEVLCSVVDVIIQDNREIRNYSALYFFKVYLEDEYLFIAQSVISVGFVVSFYVSTEFINISVWFFTHTCHLVFYRFKYLNVKLEKILRSDKQLSSFDLAEYRKEHQLACQVTEELRDLWSPLIFFWIFGLILNLCFALRGLHFSNSTLFMIAYVADVVRQLWLLIGLFKAGSIVNIEAHRLAEKLVTFSVSKSSSLSTLKEQMDYNINYMLLCERLINTRIGISASGMFLLNSSSFLSMAATVLTYVIVLYQSH